MTTTPAPVPKPLATQKSDFTAEGSPPPGMVATSTPLGLTDAVALLVADHVVVAQLFAEYDKGLPNTDKKELVSQLCTALSVHVQIEEEIFYPAIESLLADSMLVPEARLEHAGVKNLIAQLEGAEPDGVMYDAKVKVLGEYVKHHVRDEQAEMFPQVQATSIDLKELGARMATRRQELVALRAS